MRWFSAGLLFWILVLQCNVQLQNTLDWFRRKDSKRAGDALAYAILYERFTPELVQGLHACVVRGIEHLRWFGTRELPDRLSLFGLGSKRGLTTPADTAH